MANTQFFFLQHLASIYCPLLLAIQGNCKTCVPLKMQLLLSMTIHRPGLPKTPQHHQPPVWLDVRLNLLF